LPIKIHIREGLKARFFEVEASGVSCQRLAAAELTSSFFTMPAHYKIGREICGEAIQHRQG
jgi:hypothetical protein